MKKILLFGAAALMAASASAATEWVSLIEGGNANDGESPSIIAGWTGPAQTVANPAGEGKVYEIAIAANPENPWDSQLFIKFNEPLQVGDKFKVSFDYYCSDARSIEIQAQGEPGAYQHWTMGINALSAKPEWQNLSTEELEVSAEMAGAAGFLTMAFNLASAPEAATFYVNNVVILHEVEVEAPADPWVSIIEGGNANDGQSASIIAGWTGPAPVVANPAGEGQVYEIAIAANPENPWDSQLFIKFNEPLQVGDKFKVSFDYYCSDARSIDIQAQGEPGAYQHWTMGINALSAKPEWQSVNTEELEVSAEMAGAAGFLTMAFNLASAPEAATFYVNNVKVVKYDESGSVETIAPVKVVATGVYNLNGVKVADSLDEVTVPGLYIVNGKKVIKK